MDIFKKVRAEFAQELINTIMTYNTIVDTQTHTQHDDPSATVRNSLPIVW